MFLFTKQEQIFLLSLLGAFLIGIGVKVAKQRAHPVDKAWQQEKLAIYKEFKRRSLAINSDSVKINTGDSQEAPRIRKSAIVGFININSATKEELQLLPGIGSAISEQIILYRETYGPFSHIQDIQRVKRIGPKTFESIKNYITID